MEATSYPTEPISSSCLLYSSLGSLGLKYNLIEEENLKAIREGNGLSREYQRYKPLIVNPILLLMENRS